MSHYKTIVLCADDFGLNAGVSKGILKLVGMHRLSAVSCLVNMADFNKHVKDVPFLKKNTQIGLHFNCTEGYLLSMPDRPCFGLNELLIKTHLKMIQPSLIAKEFNAQLDHYIDIMGHFPGFIDGHQHVHQFPIIQQVILKIYEKRLRKNGTFIRSTFPAINLSRYQFKGHILAATGGRSLTRRLKKLNIPHNDYFSGIYDFDPETNYRDLFRQWLSRIPADTRSTLFMCHPGEDKANSDVISQARNLEMAYFLSDEFLEDCREFEINLTTGPKP